MSRKLLFCLVAVLTIISCKKKTNESSITVSLIYPGQEGIGATVEIEGKGFGTNPSTTSVLFNGAKAKINVCFDSLMFVVIPAGATTGPITISSPGHQVYKSDSNFVILTGTWVQKSNFPGLPRVNATSFSIGNIGYVVGGANAVGTQLNDMYAYDPAADSWSQKASLPAGGRSNGFGMTIGNKAYLIGGSNGQQNLPDVWEYDPSTDSWTQLGNFPGEPKVNAAGFSIGNMGYYGLGNGAGTTLDWWQYNSVTDTWTRKGDFLYVTYSANYGYTLNGTGYLLTNGSYQDWYSYDTAGDKWTPVSNWLPAYIDADGTPVTVGNQADLITGTGILYLTWSYDASTGVWFRQTSPGIMRSGAVGAGLNNRMYFGLGSLNAPAGAPLPNDWWMLQP